MARREAVSLEASHILCDRHRASHGLLHARQCIHRDLKPENLLITANGRIKVTDFGFARIIERTEVESRKLTFCGTDAYMSPEIQQSEKFGLETDVFSLGIVFCEILTRKLADKKTFCVSIVPKLFRLASYL